MAKVSGVPYEVELKEEEKNVLDLSVKSPCVRICRLDPHKYVCLGCYRYIEEIANWRNMSDKEKRFVIENVELRRATYEADWGDTLTKQEWGRNNNCPDGRWDFNQKD